MTDPWVRLQHAAIDSLDWIWNDFAKDGRETAVLARVAESPKAAGWLVVSMAAADDCIVRKIGAMLAGLIHDDDQSHLLIDLLQRERDLFVTSPLDANSVTEDILFAATRWAGYGGKARDAGIYTLAEIVTDAIGAIPWNTVQWAAANLHAATDGTHPALSRLMAASLPEHNHNASIKRIAEAIRNGDQQMLERYTANPNPIIEFPEDARDAHLAKELWNAIKQAEIEAMKP